eukprot:gnl/Trimastix_PCT/1769.p1 GENE.gnl/Trimastix_PCT/1769~~gnl/Trimastix_PCT/1769.p1  ORF type:complete len:1122 (+),score=389.36 gnl/Trimastix_PCT/1769:381-3368(+)
MTEPDTKIEPSFLAPFSVVVVADPFQFSLDQLCFLDEYCRLQADPIAFIMAGAPGPLGFVFCDFGPRFVVDDPDGRDPPSAIISMISSESPAVVTLAEESVQLGMPFEEGQIIKFSEVQGPAVLNQGTFKIGTTTRLTFTILTEDDEPLDTSALPHHEFGSGRVNAIKRPKMMQFHSLRESLETPCHQPVIGNLPDSLLITDFRKFFNSQQLHLLVHAMLQASGVQQLPTPVTPQRVEPIMDRVRQINTDAKRFNEQLPAEWRRVAQKHCVDEIDDKTLSRLALHAGAGVLCPLAALLGGIVGQEVIKRTGKFAPLHQWFHWDLSEILSDEVLPTEEYQPLSSRYDAQIGVFGRTVQEKMNALQVFMVGAGALGCELAKGFAMMGVGVGPQGKVTITDMDTIEKSNLNRQFLFRPMDIGKPKSTAAARAMCEMNSTLNVESLTTPVGPSTERTFHDEFWPALDIVVNALDNVDARQYVDRRCAFFKRPLLESGTTGTMCNLQVIIPGKTEAYSDSQDFAQEGVPMCTVRNFPNTIEHCIEWAISDETIGSFNMLFKLVPSEILSYTQDPEKFLKELNTRMPLKSQQRAILESIHQALTGPRTFESCIEWARLKFQELFHNEILQLLYFHPADSMNASTGQKFWAGSKRLPHPVIFDTENFQHMQFVHCAANLRAHYLNIPEHRIASDADLEYFKQALANVPVPHFEPRTGSLGSGGEEEDEGNAVAELDGEGEAVEQLIATLPRAQGAFTVRPIKFEKDDDTNFHVDYCTAAANLRGECYTIAPGDRMFVKTTAGRIIPALATTTALVTGLVLTQLVQLVQGRRDPARFANGSLNIANHVWGFSEPLNAPTFDKNALFRAEIEKYQKDKAEYEKAGCPYEFSVRCVPEGWTSYDFVVLEGDLTVAEIIAELQAKFHLDAKLIGHNSKALWYEAGSATMEARKARKVIDLYNELFADKPLAPQQKFVLLEVEMEDPESEFDAETIFTPPVALKFRA